MAMVVSNDIAREDLGYIKHDYMALGAMIKGMVAQGSLILLVRWKSSRKSRWILWVNNWLHSWYQQQGLSWSMQQ